MIHLFGHLYAPEDRGLCLVSIEDERISAIEPVESAAVPAGVLGGPNARILPGLLDLQINGAFGYDFADASAPMEFIRREMLRFGVTGFVPTIVTSAAEVYGPALANLRRSSARGASAVLGVHIEGPYISPNHPGSHSPQHLRLPNVREAAGWLEAGDVSWLTLAPELPGALELIRFLVREGVRVSMGHTDATWSDAAAAADAGATMATHLFNAMRPFRHRDPGVAGFALATDLDAGFIADGNHLAFETIRLIGRAKGTSRMILVSDALAGLGMPPGRYWLASREYISDGTCGRLPDGTLSGSLLPLNAALRNLVEMAGMEVAEAVATATSNPARALGLDATHGRVALGRRADVVLVDAGWNVLATIAGGTPGFAAEGTQPPTSAEASA